MNLAARFTGEHMSGHCPVCGSLDATFVSSRGSLRLLRCTRCTLAYSFPQPIAVVREKYLEHLNLSEHFEPWAARKRVLYERRLRDLGPPEPGRNRLCDVGCADGQFLALAKERGWEPFGIEMNPPAAAKARERGATVYQGILEEIPDLPYGTFDVVTSWDALEHTPTPREFASRLTQLVAPGGRLVVTTLNHRSLAWLVFGMKWSMVVDDHFTYWNRRSLQFLFAEQGMKLISYRAYGLGRDFVSFVDSLRHTNRPVNQPAPSATPNDRWDVRPTTLAIEDAVNHLLRWSGLGVGLYASFVRESR